MVRTFLKVYMELGSYFFVSARTNKRLLHHHHHPAPTMTGCRLVGECEGGCPVLGGRPLRRRAVARVAFGRLCWLGPSWPPVPRLRLQRPRPPGRGGVGSPLQIGVWAEGELLGVFGREEEEGEVRSGPGAAMPSSSTQCGHPVIALAAPPCVACEGSTCSCDHGQIPNEGAAGSKDAELGAFRPNTCRWICSGFFQG